MKALAAALVLMTLGSHAMADQCQAVSGAEADRAKILLQPGAKVIDNCEPCGGSRNKPYVVKSVALGSMELGTDKYSTILVNGKEIDLAYTFVQVAPGRFVNVAKVVGCSQLLADTVSSVINAKSVPVMQEE